MWGGARASSVKTLLGCMLSNPGLKREINEDRAAYVLPKPTNGRRSDGDFLAIVADGMGGHAAGEIASAMAIDIVYRSFFNGRGSPGTILKAGMRMANAIIYEHAQTNPECAGMGTTCTALAIRDGRAFLAHVGDSRCYLLRAGCLHQLSQDHSLVSDLVRTGVISAEEARESPDRNIILRAIGTKPSVDISVWSSGLPLKPADVVLLCSDGLTDGVGDDAIREILMQDLPPADACDLLVDAALAAGGDDNITVGVFVAYGEGEGEGEGEDAAAAAPPSDDPVRATRVTKVMAKSQ
jgi:serine/threonine protein phosphatase PrpC